MNNARLSGAYRSEVDLVAALVGQKNAERLMAKYKSLVALFHGSPSDWGLAPGLTDRLCAAILISHRYAVAAAQQTSQKVFCSADIYEIAWPYMVHEQQEVFLVIGVAANGEVVGVEEVARGSVNEVRVTAADVIRLALRMGVPRIVVVHNHPSGDPTPSPADVKITDRLQKAADLMGLALLDHVVCARAAHSSMRDMGVIASSEMDVSMAASRK
jgi:DNA repair protein RadC